MSSIAVVLDYSLWKKKLKNPKLYLKKKILKLNKLKFFKDKSNNHTVLLTNNKKMKVLNRKFWNKNKPTDVLSFPYDNTKNYKKINI